MIILTVLSKNLKPGVKRTEMIKEDGYRFNKQSLERGNSNFSAMADLSVILPRVLIVSRRSLRKNKFVDFVGTSLSSFLFCINLINLFFICLLQF